MKIPLSNPWNLCKEQNVNQIKSVTGNDPWIKLQLNFKAQTPKMCLSITHMKFFVMKVNIIVIDIVVIGRLFCNQSKITWHETLMKISMSVMLILQLCCLVLSEGSQYEKTRSLALDPFITVIASSLGNFPWTGSWGWYILTGKQYLSWSGKTFWLQSR